MVSRAAQDRQRRYRESPKGIAAQKAYVDRNRAAIKAQSHAYYMANRDRLLARQEARRQQNRDQWLQSLKVRQLRNNHGMFPEDWAAMWAAQGGRCYLCREPMDPEKRISIDHDHSCCPQAKSCPACRRGLAHNDCNVMIGLVGDDPGRLRLAADALEAANRDVTQRMAMKGEQLLLDEGIA